MTSKPSPAALRRLAFPVRRAASSSALGALTLALVLVPATVARAQAPATDELPRIRISDPNRDLFRLALPPATGDAGLAAAATDIERRDLSVVGLFRLLDPASFPPALREEATFSSTNWAQVGAQGVAKMRVVRQGADAVVEGTLFQIGRGDGPVLSKSYKGTGDDVRAAVHAWSNDVVAHFTGVPGVFGSRIAYAQAGRSGSKEIASVDMDGSRPATVTRMGSDCLLPSYSPGGGEIAFTSFLRGNPDLWIVSAGGGRARRVSKQPGMNTGATWGPGGMLVLTLSFEGSPDLYKISARDGAIAGKLTDGPSIETSPAFSPDGSQIAFVSNRQGSPQIFIMPAGGGAARRLTFQGRYNQTPAWNPRPDKPLIAFTGRDERGVFDIFTIDVKTGKAERVTQNQGSNHDPSWSPDGRLLVYASSRGGLWIQNIETGLETQISKAAAASPSWGPVPRR